MDVMPVRLDNSAGIDGLNRRSGIPGDSDKKDDGLTHLLASDQALKISDDKNIPHQISPKDEDHVQPAERESSGPAAGDTTVDIAVEYVQKEVAKINDVAVDQKIVNGGLKGHVESPGSRHYKILVRLLPWVPRTLLLTILSHVPGADGRPTQNSFTYETLDFSSSSAALVSLALGLFLATAFGQVSKCSIDKALGLGRSGVRVGIMAAALPIILGGLASFALDDPENISNTLYYIAGIFFTGSASILYLLCVAPTSTPNAIPIDKAGKSNRSSQNSPYAHALGDDGCDCNGQGCSKCGGGGSGGSSVKRQ